MSLLIWLLAVAGAGYAIYRYMGDDLPKIETLAEVAGELSQPSLAVCLEQRSLARFDLASLCPGELERDEFSSRVSPLHQMVTIDPSQLLSAWLGSRLDFDGESVVRFMPDDADATRHVLTGAGVHFEERPVLDTFLPDEPGALASMAERLAEAGVNIDSIYLLHSNAEGLHFAVTVDDPDLARAELG